MGIDTTALAVLLFFFIVVTAGGFWAARWRRADTLDSLEEWGLGGRGFGTVITWFLLGGDLYTAYTFIAVPAAMYATGAVSGFFAIAYSILAYPIIFVFMPRLWSVCHRHGFVTAADFIRARYDSRLLSLAIAVTGIVATMPYIALQLVGIQAVLDSVGFGGNSNAVIRDLPLLLAFAVLAAYTYSSGLRAPALIAFVKDALIYLVIGAAAIYVGVHFGFHQIFTAADAKLSATKGASFVPARSAYWSYATLALGSAMALFMYPHCLTAVLAGKSRNVIRRNAAILPTYSIMLGLLALLGYAAIAAKTSIIGVDGKPNPQLAIPHWFRDEFPSWFTGIAYAAIAIGALVPAAIMSIGAANLFTRNIYREYLRPSATPKQEAAVSKLTSLVVKFGALAFVLILNKQNAINFQLLGGIWMLQTFLAVVVGLYGRWLHRWALLAGWACGTSYGTASAYQQSSPLTHHFATSLAPLPFSSTKVYIAATALIVNVVVSVVLTLLFRALAVSDGMDATSAADYHSEPTIAHVGEKLTV